MALKVLVVSADPDLDLPPWSSRDVTVTVCAPPAWVGRAAFRAGPVRVLPGRWASALWLLRSRTAAALLAGADLLVSADELSRPAVWLAARRHGKPGVDGLTAATMYVHGDRH